MFKMSGSGYSRLVIWQGNRMSILVIGPMITCERSSSRGLMVWPENDEGAKRWRRTWCVRSTNILSV